MRNTLLLMRIPLLLGLPQVLSWIRTHGEVTVTKYMNLSLDCGNLIKDHEQEFEKFYFVSMVSLIY